MKLLFLLCLGIGCSAFAATPYVYRWVDENGVTHFSDSFHAGATKIPLEEPATINNSNDEIASTPPNNTTINSNELTTVADNSLPEKYTVNLTTPVDQAVIPAGERSQITVTAEISPQLTTDDLVELVVDGKVLQTSSQSAFIWANPDRGTHTLALSIVRGEGKLKRVISSSKTITVYVRQTSSLQ